MSSLIVITILSSSSKHRAAANIVYEAYIRTVICKLQIPNLRPC
jgi:hypothetical protein